MLIKSSTVVVLSFLISFTSMHAFAQQPEFSNDSFYWLGEINKASTIINTDEGLLDKSMTPLVIQGIRKVLSDGRQPGAPRPDMVITFEPLLIEAAGPQVTLLHAGRSSQDMLATVNSALLRDDMLTLASQLNKTTNAIVELAKRQRETIVPNYTNGVAAQPNSYGHYLLGLTASLDRDAQRIREAYARIDLSPMGTTVLNGTSWPLNRKRMAEYLGFSGTVDNAYDAGQMTQVDQPIEAGAIVNSIAVHSGMFVEDVMTQYAQPRPWILLQEGGGNTYVSSAMPQKRNPGLLNDTRHDASNLLAMGMATLIRAHNIPPGMTDTKILKDTRSMMAAATRVLRDWERIVSALVIDRKRALEELNSDWTASQELADVLMRKYKLPFRVGHHFASEIVEYAKSKNILPLDFPYSDAQRIYVQTVQGGEFPPALPMSEDEFRSALDPLAIVRNRATAGGPQPKEMDRMLKEARDRIANQDRWIQKNRERIAGAIAHLNSDFDRLGATVGVR